MPQTRMGRLAVGGDVISLVFLGVFVGLVSSGQRGGDTFFSNPWLAWSILAAGAAAIAAGVPVPVLSASLAWFDSIRTARGSTNLIQAQRDFFGEHGFKRTDKDGNHHGPWKT